MKSLRYIKLRTHCRNFIDLAFERPSNPFCREVSVEMPTHEYTSKYLESFKLPLKYEQALVEP